LVELAALASDADATNSGISYALTSNPGNLFEIDPQTGVVRTAAAMDRETVGPSVDIAVTVTSEDGSTAARTFNIAIGNVNHASTLEDQALTIAAADLTGNDTDVDGDSRTLTAVSNASHGSVELVDGNVVFTPDADFNGVASFDYTVSDGNGGTDTGSVAVYVGAVNDAPVVGSNGGGALASISVSLSGG
jgi:hypothetical protein